MYLDAVDLKQFYQSRLGRQTRAKLRGKIRHIWPNVKGDRVLGLGYPTPFLGSMLNEAERVLAFMPASQGVFRWPYEKASITTLIHENKFPLPDSSIDRVLLTHILEATDNPRDLLAEIWRILTPGGKILIVVPNRSGLWVRLENTPFGYGRPFSHGQLTDLVRITGFSPTGWISALHTPPIERRSFLTSRWVETMGERFFSRLSGVFLMEANKELYKSLPLKQKKSFAPAFKPIWVPSPAAPTTPKISPSMDLKFETLTQKAQK